MKRLGSWRPILVNEARRAGNAAFLELQDEKNHQKNFLVDEAATYLPCALLPRALANRRTHAYGRRPTHRLRAS